MGSSGYNGTEPMRFGCFLLVKKIISMPMSGDIPIGIVSTPLLLKTKSLEFGELFEIYAKLKLTLPEGGHFAQCQSIAAQRFAHLEDTHQATFFKILSTPREVQNCITKVFNEEKNESQLFEFLWHVSKISHLEPKDREFLAGKLKLVAKALHKAKAMTDYLTATYYEVMADFRNPNQENLYYTQISINILAPSGYVSPNNSGKPGHTSPVLIPTVGGEFPITDEGAGKGDENKLISKIQSLCPGQQERKSIKMKQLPAIKIQAHIRGFLDKVKFKKTQKQIVTVQAEARNFLAVREYPRTKKSIDILKRTIKHWHENWILRKAQEAELKAKQNAFQDSRKPKVVGSDDHEDLGVGLDANLIKLFEEKIKPNAPLTLAEYRLAHLDYLKYLEAYMSLSHKIRPEIEI